MVTSVAADEAGVGGRHGARSRVRESVSCQQENPAGKSSGVEGREGVHEASRVAENPGGDRQGVGGGVKPLQGVDTPLVEELP